MSRKQNAEILAQMFSGYGQAVTPERVAMYTEVIGDVSPERLRKAVSAAMRNTTGGFPPAPGDIVCELRHSAASPGRRPRGIPAPEQPKPGSERWKTEIEPERTRAKQMGLLSKDKP